MFKQYGNSFTLLLGYKKKTGKLVLAKLGQVKMVLHRPIKGKPKTAIVKRTPTGKWDVAHQRGNRAGDCFLAFIGGTGWHRCRPEHVCLSLDRRADRQSAFLPQGGTGLACAHRKLSKSQTCSGCGYQQEMPHSARVYGCSAWGLVIDRDYNGSKNILGHALEAVGRHGRVIPEAPGL